MRCGQRLEPPELIDGTVLLRAPREGDVAAVFAYGQDPDLHATHWLPVFCSCSWAIAQRVIADCQRGWDGPYGLTWVIADPVNQAFLGVIMLGYPGAAVGEVAYGVAPRHRNRGLATRAVRLVTAWAIEQLGLPRIEIRTTVHNVASQRVAEKAGFVREGMVHTRVPATGLEYDDVVYALVSTPPANP